jgi:hypothetical protein
MVATTQVRFLVEVNYDSDFKKFPSPVKPGFGGLFFLMKTVGRSYPTGLVFSSFRVHHTTAYHCFLAPRQEYTGLCEIPIR